jgi:hypothetical protein
MANIPGMIFIIIPKSLADFLLYPLLFFPYSLHFLSSPTPFCFLSYFTPYLSVLVLILHKLLEESLRRGKLPSIDESSSTSSIRAALSSQSHFPSRSRSRSRSQSHSHTLSLSQPLPNNRHLSISSTRSCPNTPRTEFSTNADKVTTALLV